MTLTVLSVCLMASAAAFGKDQADVTVKYLGENTIRVCEIDQEELAHCNKIKLPARLGEIVSVIATIQVPAAKISFLTVGKRHTHLCALSNDLSGVYCGVVSTSKEPISLSKPAAKAATELGQALRQRDIPQTPAGSELSKFEKVAKELEVKVTGGICYPYTGDGYELPVGETWCDEPCVGNNYCPIIEIIAPGPQDPHTPSLPSNPPIGLPGLPTPVWPSDPTWCNVLGVFCDNPAPPPPPPTPEECRRIYEEGRDHCLGVMNGTIPGGLPGSGSDTLGRYRRCVREFTEGRGCFDY